MTLSLILAAGVAALGSPAGHETAADAPAAVIRYNDLNLATEAGQRVLKTRIAAAERATCSTGPLTGSRIDSASAECRASFRKAVAGKMEAAIAKAQHGRLANSDVKPAGGVAQ